MTIGNIPALQRQTTRVIRMRELREKLRLSPSHLYALIAKGQFPPPFPLVSGGRAKGWDEADIEAYLNARKGPK